ncbi:hypothetical protein M4D70_05780 [Brevibacillus borstelensis]|uniref:hypothetical protein n=1 Tax=Brevibacillus borstelensis TaxID=45462 RepID=UPI002040F29A|nr:hypothetical protein [Brevibacillus borstelensis]MCM3621770.1 hypothetical protein [Brevibacillus borstelensis]
MSTIPAKRRCKRVHRYLWLRLLLTLTITATMLWLFFASAPSIRATWLWNTELITEKGEAILSFAEENDINRIYLHIDQKNVPPEAYRTFIKEASARDIQVDALGGDPAWSLVSSQKSIASFIDWVHVYNRAAAEDERFTGIHVDIEPHVHPQWKRDKEALKSQWMENMQLVVQETKKDPALQVSADIPFWMNELPASETQSVSEWLIGQLDHVTLMAYRDYVEGSNGVLDISSRILDEAGYDRQKVVVGLNVLESDEGDRTTFYEEDTKIMREQVSILETRMKKYSAYAGYAIHDYEQWEKKSRREKERSSAKKTSAESEEKIKESKRAAEEGT